jgi:hypothetical protein
MKKRASAVLWGAVVVGGLLMAGAAEARGFGGRGFGGGFGGFQSNFGYPYGFGFYNPYGLYGGYGGFAYGIPYFSPALGSAVVHDPLPPVNTNGALPPPPPAEGSLSPAEYQMALKWRAYRAKHPREYQDLASKDVRIASLMIRADAQMGR